MKIIEEEFWKKPEFPTLFVITTNNVIEDDRLVMGAGVAKEARDRISGLDSECARKIEEYQFEHQNEKGIKKEYGFLVVRYPIGGKNGVAILQTKKHFDEDSPLALVAYSIKKMSEWVAKNPNIPVRMVYPGIGHGNLSEGDVEPLLNMYLSKFENVVICKK